MFNVNSYHGGNHSSSLHINAVTGAIVKNHKESWFERFNLKSQRASDYLGVGGHKDPSPYSKTWSDGVVVLQMVICGDMEVIAECVYKKDFERVFDDE